MLCNNPTTKCQVVRLGPEYSLRRSLSCIWMVCLKFAKMLAVWW
jgi:hypothetical protein